MRPSDPASFRLTAAPARALALARVLALAPALVFPIPALAAPDTAVVSACRVSVVRPRETDMLYGVVDLAADVSCPEGRTAASLAFLVDGIPAGERTAPPWKVTWNAGGGFASHLVEARLTDSDGGRASAIVLTPGAILHESVRVTSTPIDLVELSVSVTDGEGRPVSGLAREDFVVEEEGRPQALNEVRTEHRPLSIAVLIDASSSVRAFWPALGEAAPALARTLRQGDAIKAVAFSGPAYLVQDFTADPGRVERAMERFQAWGGGTSLYDTLAAVGTELAWGRGGRQAVVLITDGIDTLSRIDAPRLRNYLRRTDVVVETFLVRPTAKGAMLPPAKFGKTMDRLCRDTSGSLRPVRDLEGMTKAFQDLGESLQDRYYLAYHSDQAAREGWRSIRVEVRRPPGVLVRARRSVIGNRPVGGFLLAEMKSRDPAVRRKAAEWLGTMPAEGAGEALLRALSDRSLPVREAAATALGRIREPRAVEPLVDLLRDRSLGLRDAAAQGLQAFGPAAVPALLSALDRQGDQTRIEILDVLAAIGDARAVEAIERLAAPPPPPAKTLAGELPESTPRDRRSQAEVRVWALRALGRMGSDEILPTLEKGVRDRDPDVIAAAFAALVEHASPESFKTLHRLGQATERDARVRAAARHALVEGFYRLERSARLAEWLEQPIGAAIFVWVVEAAASATAAVEGWAGVIEAVGGGERAAALLDVAAGHLPRDVASLARSLAAGLKGR